MRAMIRTFTKMHGLGNDFVIVDARGHDFSLHEGAIKSVADRRRGIGCDQVLLLETPLQKDCDVLMRIFNADGKEVGACGNGARCVGWLIAQELGRPSVTIETKAGRLFAERYENGEVRIAIGKPSFHWEDIPLLRAMDTDALDIEVENLSAPMAVSVGNPHMVFFVESARDIALRRIGSLLEHHHLFPQGANIGIAEVIDRQTLYLRVWERGAGLTEACGTGACAAVAAGVKRSLLGQSCRVIQEGGALMIEQDEEGMIHMRGAVALVYKGEFSDAMRKALVLKPEAE